MSKNLIYTTAINSDTSKISNDEYSQYSIKSWEYWCRTNNIDFLIIDKSYRKYKYPVWNKDIIFELVGDKYDKIGYVDSDTMVRWDAPNIFDLYDNEFCGVVDNSSLRWVYNSMKSFNKFYDDIEIGFDNYINSGISFFTKNHKYIFDNLIDLYEKNSAELDKIGGEGWGRVQTILNYELKKTKTKLKFLNSAWNLVSIHKKEMFNHNWQLNENPTPFFVKYAYVWHFTGFPIQDRVSLMKQTWELYKDNYRDFSVDFLLDSVKHKDEFKNATSRKFKKDLIEFFDNDKYKDMSVVELGACHGDTTKIFSQLFKNVHAVDWKESNIQLAKDKCKSCKNISYQVLDTSVGEWNFPKADVVFIDSSHDYSQLMVDIEKVISYFKNPIIILDDHGNPNNTSIRRSIDEKIKDGKLKIHKIIGEYPGFKTKSGWSMIDREGVICNV